MLSRLDTVKDWSQSCQHKSKCPTSLIQKKRKNVRDQMFGRFLAELHRSVNLNATLKGTHGQA